MASAGQGNVGANLGSALLQGRQARINQSVAEAEKAAAMKKSQQELEKYQSEQILKAQKEGFQTPVFTGTGYGMEPLQMDPNMPQPSAGFSEKTLEYYDPASGQAVLIQSDGAGGVRAVDLLGRPWQGDTSKLVNPRLDPNVQGSIAENKALGGARGATQAEAEATLPSVQRGLDRTRRDFTSFFDDHLKVRDAQGNLVDINKTPFDPETMTVEESVALRGATGSFQGELGTFNPQALFDQDVKNAQRALSKFEAEGFLEKLVSSKAEGATFGSLTAPEQEALTASYSLAVDPTVDGPTRVKAYQTLMEDLEAIANITKARAKKGGTGLSDNAKQYF